MNLVPPQRSSTKGDFVSTVHYLLRKITLSRVKLKIKERRPLFPASGKIGSNYYYPSTLLSI